MNSDLATLVAILSAMAIFLVAMAHTVNGAADMMTAMGNLCSAIEHLIVRFRRMMKTLGRRIRSR